MCQAVAGLIKSSPAPAPLMGRFFGESVAAAAATAHANETMASPRSRESAPTTTLSTKKRPMRRLTLMGMEGGGVRGAGLARTAQRIAV